jgi:hypothetical protein
MGHEHRGRIAVPNLDGVDVQQLPGAVNVQKNLCGLPNPGQRVKRMVAAHQRKKGDCVHFKQIRTGHAEKVAHHQVRGPGALQLGQAVENIENAAALTGDDVVNPGCKRLEALVGVQRKGDRVPGGNKGGMLGETHIDQTAAVALCLFDEFCHENGIILQRGYLKDHIVSDPDVIEQRVQTGNA